MRYARPMLLAGLAALCLWGQRPAAAAVSLEQEVQAGQAFTAAFVKQYGLSENAGYRELADSVLSRLVKASGERPELQQQWKATVLKYNPANPVAKNASAWPGGYIILDDELMKTIADAAQGDAERNEALLAGVLAHEISHVIHHDTDALAEVYLKQRSAAPPQLIFTLNSRNTGPKVSADDQRAKESACDRYGAFYLLRAGYEVDDMARVFRRLSDAKVDEVLFGSDLDHAPASERISTVLGVKEQVEADERLYDEAVNILSLGLSESMLMQADANLQKVAKDLPRLLSVRHAQAVLHHRYYLIKMHADTLVYKPSFAFYRFQGTRGPKMTDDLEEAVSLYKGILDDYADEGDKGLGPTAAAYALGLAQMNRNQEALDWARRAVALAPDDWNGYNVLGIALMKNGKPDDAAQQFATAVKLVAPDPPTELIDRSLLLASMEERIVWKFVLGQKPAEFGPALYNLGLALKAKGDKALAAHVFLEYLATDTGAGSEWAQAAEAQVKALGGAPRAGHDAPLIAGVDAGMSDLDLSKNKALLTDRGISQVEPSGQVWRYRSKGFSLFLDETNRVRAALLYAPYDGEIGPGVKIGASKEQVDKVWGPPVNAAEKGDRELRVYPAQGLTFLLSRGKLAKVIWAPATRVGGADVGETLAVRPGLKPADVKKELGDPTSVEKPDPNSDNGALWTYDREGMGMRVRFDNTGAVALVTISRPSTMALAGVKIGDPAERIRQMVGTGVVSTDVENSQTYSFPDKGMAFVVRNAEVSVMTVFAGTNGSTGMLPAR